jgi:hypothetical protein
MYAIKDEIKELELSLKKLKQAEKEAFDSVK